MREERCDQLKVFVFCRMAQLANDLQLPCGRKFSSGFVDVKAGPTFKTACTAAELAAVLAYGNDFLKQAAPVLSVSPRCLFQGSALRFFA